MVNKLSKIKLHRVAKFFENVETLSICVRSSSSLRAIYLWIQDVYQFGNLKCFIMKIDIYNRAPEITMPQCNLGTLYYQILECLPDLTDFTFTFFNVDNNILDVMDAIKTYHPHCKLKIQSIVIHVTYLHEKDRTEIFSTLTQLHLEKRWLKLRRVQIQFDFHNIKNPSLQIEVTGWKYYSARINNRNSKNYWMLVFERL